MYVAVTGSGKARVIQFVEQYRILGTKKKKTQVVRTIGNYEAMLEENPSIIEELRLEAKRLTEEKKQQQAPILLKIANQDIRNPDDALATFRFGHSIGAELWSRLGIDECLKKHCTKRNLPALSKAIQGLLLHRIANPRSVLASFNDLSDFAGFGDVSLDTHYQSLELLMLYREDIITQLARFFEKNTTRHGPQAYYDVTTYSFESVHEGELRMFGYSKDHKNQEVQVVMGLLLDNNGIPITFELFPGSTMDQKTLNTAVESLKNRYRLDKIVIIADRGLNGKDNLEMLLTEKHDFVVGFTLKTASEALKEIALDESGWVISEVSEDGEILSKEKTIPHRWKTQVLLTEAERSALPKQQGRKKKYKELEIEANLHLSWRLPREKKDQTDRDRILQKVDKMLENPSRVKSSLKRGRNQYLTFDVMTEDMQLDKARVESQARFDGIYAIVTSDKSRSNREVQELYGGLWQIEESFRVLKTDLRARPVFVWNDKRIQGHFVLCFIALCLVRYIQYLLPIQAETKERAKPKDIREAFWEPSVMVVGETPFTKLIPIRVTQTYLDLAKILGMPPLQTVMNPSAFKKATGLNINDNLNRIKGQK